MTGTGTRPYRELGEQAGRLANALRRIGITGDQRVATFMWNNAEHLTAYMAVPSMGAVLHTLNIRLSPEQIAFIANEAEDQVIIADLSLAGQLAAVLPLLETVHTVIAVGDGDIDALTESGKTVLRYDEVLAAESPSSTGRRSTRSPRRRCATPAERRGIRKALSTAIVRAICTQWHDRHRQRAWVWGSPTRCCPIVPMFHANAWGMPYAALMAGAEIVMTDRFLDSKSLIDLIETQRPTVAARGADDLERRPALPGKRSRTRHLVAAAGDVRRVGGADVDDEGVREAARRPDRASVGDDRDLAAGDDGAAAAGRSGRAALGAARHARAGRCAASRRGSSTTTAIRCRTTARRSARCRCAAHGSPARTTATTTSRSSPTAGCTPATSAASTRSATSR